MSSSSLCPLEGTQHGVTDPGGLKTDTSPCPRSWTPKNTVPTLTQPPAGLRGAGGGGQAVFGAGRGGVLLL